MSEHTAENDHAAAMAELLCQAAHEVAAFADWYPVAVFPGIEEALADGFEPTREQVAASSYRHAYGEVVPRYLRHMAREITDGPACDDCGEWETCQCSRGRFTR